MRLYLVVFVMVCLCSCSTSVKRIESDSTVDLSGVWNDSDSRLTAEEMINDVLGHNWIDKYVARKGKMPTVIVGKVTNLSHEHINVKTFISDIERSLINSGRISFVASSKEREEIRAERKDQDVHASEDSRKEAGNELGADFMLKGKINTIIDMEGNKQIRYYQVDIDLISLADNRKVWIGQKKIKKFVTNSRVRY